MKLMQRLFNRSKRTSPESVWDKSAAQYVVNDFKTYWEMLVPVAYYQFDAMTGDKDLDYLTYTINYLRDHVGTSNLTGLSIGCSQIVAPEMRLVETGFFSRFQVMDIAEGLLQTQSKVAREKGLKQLEYVVQDLNRVELEENAYDLIWAVGTLHHLENLEDFFDQIQKALTPRGILVMREYVGPNRIQLTDKQLALTNEILSLLPEKYRHTPSGAVIHRQERPNLEEMMRIDPSESVRSQDVVPVMKDKLDVFHLAETGGTILHPLLNQIASNFEQDEDGIAILNLIILLERTVIAAGLLPSDYVFALAKKRLTA